MATGAVRPGLAEPADRDKTFSARMAAAGLILDLYDSLGDVGAALEGGKPESLTRLYERLGL